MVNGADSNNISNEEILKLIENPDDCGIDASVKVKRKKFIIFSMDNVIYAMPGEHVQEVVLDYKIFFIPFAPPYVRGLINRHGEPYTVVDLNMLFHSEEHNGKAFLVLRKKIDNLSFVISSIIKIENVSENDIHEVVSDDSNLNYFESSITVDEKEIFVVSIKTIMERLMNDIV